MAKIIQVSGSNLISYGSEAFLFNEKIVNFRRICIILLDKTILKKNLYHFPKFCFVTYFCKIGILFYKKTKLFFFGKGRSVLYPLQPNLYALENELKCKLSWHCPCEATLFHLFRWGALCKLCMRPLPPLNLLNCFYSNVKQTQLNNLYGTFTLHSTYSYAYLKGTVSWDFRFWVFSFIKQLLLVQNYFDFFSLEFSQK